MSPDRRHEMARKQRIQEQIAAYREIKFEREKQRVMEQEMMAAAERQLMEETAKRRQKYYEELKNKIQQTKLDKAFKESKISVQAAQKLQVRARNTQRHSVTEVDHDRKVALNQVYEKYRQDKQLAEQMLLIPSQPVKFNYKRITEEVQSQSSITAPHEIA